jgi:hypothetical protein
MSLATMSIINSLVLIVCSLIRAIRRAYVLAGDVAMAVQATCENDPSENRLLLLQHHGLSSTAAIVSVITIWQTACHYVHYQAA